MIKTPEARIKLFQYVGRVGFIQYLQAIVKVGRALLALSTRTHQKSEQDKRRCWRWGTAIGGSSEVFSVVMHN